VKDYLSGHRWVTNFSHNVWNRALCWEGEGPFCANCRYCALSYQWMSGGWSTYRENKITNIQFGRESSQTCSSIIYKSICILCLVLLPEHVMTQKWDEASSCYYVDFEMVWHLSQVHPFMFVWCAATGHTAVSWPRMIVYTQTMYNGLDIVWYTIL
jgi:hypothetical protein